MALNTTPTSENANSYVTLEEANAYLINRQNISKWNELTSVQKEAILIMATNHIDSFRFFSEEIFRTAKYYRNKQKLKFPRKKYSTRQTGRVNGVGNNFFIDPSRANNSYEPNDFWNDGAVIIIDGTGKGQTRKISDFDSNNGKITISENWGTNPDTTSQYYLVEKMPDEIKNAVYEQALFISQTSDSQRDIMQSSGVTEYSIGDLSEEFGGVSNYDIKISSFARVHLFGFINRIGKIII